MRVAVFYPMQYTAWSITVGVRDAFKRMGHEVLDCGIMDGQTLTHQDLLFVCAPEYLMPKVREKYPLWDSLTAKKVGWLHETVEREDYATNKIAVDGKLPVDVLKVFTPHLFTPAIQDQKYELQHLPFGVDTRIFYPRTKGGVGSIYTGSLYQKRRDFIAKYPEVRTLAGYHEYPSIEEYADAIGKATTILNLPTLSETSNTRTFEALASQTVLITPTLTHDDAIFQSGEHLLYYDESPALVFEKLTRVMKDRLPLQGYAEILKKHTIEHRLEEVLKKINIRPLRFSRR